MNTLIRALALALLFTTTATAQLVESGNIAHKISNLVSAMPGAGGDDYVPPTGDQLADWEAMLDNVLEGEYAAAAAQASALSYDLVEFSDTRVGKTFYVLERADGGGVLGHLCVQPQPLPGGPHLGSPASPVRFQYGEAGHLLLPDA